MSTNEREGQQFDNVYELEMEGPLDWAAALRELEDVGPKPAAKKVEPGAKPAPEQAKTPSPRATPMPVAQRTPLPVQTLGRADTEQVDTRFSEVMLEVNKAMNQLRRFEQNHPYLIAPNIYRVWEDGLKETSLGMTREFQRMRDSDEEG